MALPALLPALPALLATLAAPSDKIKPSPSPPPHGLSLLSASGAAALAGSTPGDAHAVQQASRRLASGSSFAGHFSPSGRREPFGSGVVPALRCPGTVHGREVGESGSVHQGRKKTNLERGETVGCKFYNYYHFKKITK